MTHVSSARACVLWQGSRHQTNKKFPHNTLHSADKSLLPVRSETNLTLRRSTVNLHQSTGNTHQSSATVFKPLLFPNSTTNPVHVYPITTNRGRSYPRPDPPITHAWVTSMVLIYNNRQQSQLNHTISTASTNAHYTLRLYTLRLLTKTIR